MCGFFGLLNLKGNISQNDIREIKKGTECIRYRGPDDHNEYYDNNFIVSFNRLSILDVKPKFNSRLLIKLCLTGEARGEVGGPDLCQGCQFN